MADNVNINKSSGYDLLDNFPGSGLADYTDATREFKPSYERPDWRVEVVRALILLVAAGSAWGMFGLWKLGYCWGYRNADVCARIDAQEPVAVLALLLCIVSVPTVRVLLWALAEWRLAQARAARVATTFNRWGDPQRIDVLLPLVEEARRYQMATELKRATAPWEQYHSVNTYSPSNTAASALPAPSAPLAELIPPETWLSWMGEAPHLLISGPTGAGKTTLATALLASSSDADLLILDPHDATGKWPCAAIGGGRDYAGIYTAIDGLMAEMNMRFEALRDGTTSFPRLLVLLDEAPAVALHDLKRWQELVSRLTSEARKVEMRFIVLAQSHLVRDIGLSSLVRRNLGLVALGPQAIDLVKDETDRDRLDQLLMLVRGQKRPAAYAYAAQTEVLDVSSVPGLARQPIRLRPWSPPLVVPTSDPTLAILRSLRAAGWNRDEVRASGLSFSNDLWTAAG